jgi:hypothetical protein
MDPFTEFLRSKNLTGSEVYALIIKLIAAHDAATRMAEACLTEEFNVRKAIGHWRVSDDLAALRWNVLGLAWP